MMLRTIEVAIASIFDVEAGFQKDKLDVGNWYEGRLVGTNHGISAPTLADWLGRPPTRRDMLDLTTPVAEKILTAKYLETIRYDELPAGLDYALLDFAVNSGPARAVKKLQTILRVKADGIVGGMTLHAIKRWDIGYVIMELSNARLRYLHRLANWRRFGKGWTIRVKSVRDKALGMVSKYKTILK